MFKKLFLIVLVLGLAMLGYMYNVATSQPVVRQAEITTDNWPEGQPAISLLLVSDIHVAGPDMPPSRLAAIIAQMNALSPDIVAFAGDFVSDKRVATSRYSAADALAPLKNLQASQGVYAVLGNHDHWRDTDAISQALTANGVTILTNTAVQVGHLALGGMDDDFTNRADVPAVLAQMQSLSGLPIYLSHSPDIVPELPEAESLTLAGHTHCGQIVLPLVGAIAAMSQYGDRFACGITVEGQKTIIVSAGLGTSLLPMRLGAEPDMWLITIGPKAGK